jgi:hypothetical protein
MEEAGLFSMNEYITRCRNKLVDYVATRSIYTMCRELERRGQIEVTNTGGTKMSCAPDHSKDLTILGIEAWP